MTREVGFGNPSSETPSTNIVIMAGTSEMDGIRPPSRPQYDGEYIPSDVYRPIYPRQSHYEIAGMNSDGFASDATYDSCDSQSSTYGSPPVYYANDLEHPRSIPIQRSASQTNIPPAGDDGLIPGSMGSGAPMYSSLSIRPAPGLSPPKKAAGKGGMKAGKMFRVQRPKRKTKKEPADKETSPDPGPLSQMTGEITMVPVRDMEAFVNRPIVDRHQEVVVHGKIKRPMNSFMLYRSAYTDLAKAWLCQNSNQDVSKVMGKSWSKESPFIRQKYESLANIERENHVRAHPNYKFAPRKDKGRGPGEDGVSEFDDPDYIPGSFAARMAQPHARDSSFDNYGSRDSTPFDGAPTHGLPLSEGFYSFQSLTSNPDRPMMSASPEPHQYIQASIRPSPMGAHVEDVFCRPGLQDMQYTSSSELTGLPGGPHYMLQTSTPAPANADGQLDPRLLSFESESSVANPAYHQPNYPAWQDNRANHAYLPVPSSVPQSPTSYPMVSGPYQHGMQSIMDHGSYESGHEAGAEASGDFDRWTDPHSPGY